MKKNIRFYIALYIAKFCKVLLKTIKRDATYLPGKIAITLCPDFLGRIDKPKTIIGVTGTNGKTTVCNLIEGCLKKNGYDFIDNHLGSNINSGIATTLINGSDMLGHSKKELAVLEIDERSAPRVYPYLTPTFLVCTNLFRDSLKRNAHTEFISGILNKYIPKDTTLILNGDDLIVSSLAPDNKRVYFGIEKQDFESEKNEGIVNDLVICPKCFSKLEYSFIRYNHNGKAKCPNCDFKSPSINYDVTKINYENQKMLIKSGTEEWYNFTNDNIINLYNVLATVTLLKEFGLEHEKINNALKEMKIVDTRFVRERVGDTEIICQLAKGMNPIACSRAFDYARKEKGNKAVIVILDDLHEAASSSENIAWHYDTDYEFLKDESIKQILIAGKRHLDTYVRLLMADEPREKMIHKRDELSLVDDLKIDGIDKIIILYDLYSIQLRDQIKNKVKEKLNERNNNN